MSNITNLFGNTSAVNQAVNEAKDVGAYFPVGLKPLVVPLEDGSIIKSLDHRAVVRLDTEEIL